MRTMQDWWALLRDSGSVWQHPGDSRAPHVVLRSGKHSDGFIDTLRVLCIVKNLNAAAYALSTRLVQVLKGKKVDWVSGSPMAGIPISVAVAH